MPLSGELNVTRAEIAFSMQSGESMEPAAPAALSWVDVTVRNESEITISRMTLSHRFGGAPQTFREWFNVAPGATAAPTFRVYFNPAIRPPGPNLWWGQLTLPNQTGWINPTELVWNLTEQDHGKTFVFRVRGTEFILPDGSNSMRLFLDGVGYPRYNAWAVILLRNNFPVSVKAALTHQFESDPDQKHEWAVLSPSATTAPDDGFIVYYSGNGTGSGFSYWTLEAKLDTPPYDNAPGKAFEAFTNATKGKECELEWMDNGRTHIFTVDGTGLTLGIQSGSCFDKWKTWEGYNTFAFVEIVNRFSTTISTVVLSHRYSGDATYYHTRALVRPGMGSGYMAVEYDTGFPHFGLDYWNLYVYLDNGTRYRNHTEPIVCTLGTADALRTVTVWVSSTELVFTAADGDCADAMDYKGTYSVTAGRELLLPYNKNAFIGSHNAYANFAAGFWYAQQISTVLSQLALGGTTLLLDIWWDSAEGDVYLEHLRLNWLQPFAPNQKLSSALEAIRDFLTWQPKRGQEPVTLIFEDRVDEDHQPWIKRAFETSGTWDLVFNPDTYDVPGKGWPNLGDFSAELGQPLIVLTSNRESADFAYQWKYMSENVYGDPSLEPTTWLEPRSQSEPLSELGLCALNHFPDFSRAGFDASEAIKEAAKNNDSQVLKKMIDQCHATWKRYPNYINADFWEYPLDNGLIAATIYMNAALQLKPVPVLRFEHGRAILTDIDHSRLLCGNWNREVYWIGRHLGEICPQPDPDQPARLSWQLANATRLAMVVTTLHSVLAPGESAVRTWTHDTTRELVRYLLAVEPYLLGALGAPGAATADRYALAYFLMERVRGITFDLTEAVRGRTLPAAGSDDDRLLIAALAGDGQGASLLAERLAASRSATAPSATPPPSTTEAEGAAAESGGTVRAGASERLRDLTRQIMYVSYLDGPGVADAPLAAHLAELLDGDEAANSAAINAELLACYWLAGGTVGAASRAAVERLKARSEAHPFGCQSGKCACAPLKEQFRDRLATVLGLGSTLATAGEILDGAGPEETT